MSVPNPDQFPQWEPEKQQTQVVYVQRPRRGIPIKLWVVICFVIVCGGLFWFAANYGEEEAASKVPTRRSGQSTQTSGDAQISEQPRLVGAGDWAKFPEGAVRVMNVTRPADKKVREYNQFNDAPAAGGEYVMVWIEVSCEKPRCEPYGDLLFGLIDSSGEVWGEVRGLVIENDLDDQAALEGNVVDGWQVFEFPEGETLKWLGIGWGDENPQYSKLPPERSPAN